MQEGPDSLVVRTGKYTIFFFFSVMIPTSNSQHALVRAIFNVDFQNDDHGDSGLSI